MQTLALPFFFWAFQVTLHLTIKTNIMEMKGNLLKMVSAWNNPIDYHVQLGESLIHLNPYIGHALTIGHNGTINCIKCASKTKKAYGQGFCFNCFSSAPEADESVLKPELSKAHFGISRDMEWAEKHDLIDHFVYLALTNELKVGVTRHHQVPTRWIDQGASAAIKLAKTPNRHIAGIIEVFLKRFISDRTNWQAMLKGETNQQIDLLTEKGRIGKLLPSELQKYLIDDEHLFSFQYPVLEYPKKIEALSLDSIPVVEGILTGIRGQYLYFDTEKVFNVRKHSGYWVEININNQG
jgi:hypothetical protein